MMLTIWSIDSTQCTEPSGLCRFIDPCGVKLTSSGRTMSCDHFPVMVMVNGSKGVASSNGRMSRSVILMPPFSQDGEYASQAFSQLDDQSINLRLRPFLRNSDGQAIGEARVPAAERQARVI